MEEAFGPREQGKGDSTGLTMTMGTNGFYASALQRGI